MSAEHSRDPGVSGSEGTSPAQLMSIIDSAMDPIITVNESQRVVLFNRAAERVFGVPLAEALGSPLDRFIPERHRTEHQGHVRAFGKTGVTTRTMSRLGTVSGLRADGTEFPIEASISQVVAEGRRYYTVILRDITEKQKLEAQLLQAQKMEGIGRLAGGVAHDFNNLLMAMFNCLSLASRRLEEGHPARAPLARAQEAAERAATLTRQLLTFARKQPVSQRVVSPATVVTGIEPMLRRVIGEDVRLRTVLAPDTGNVLADAAQLEQVLMNMAVNARDAMPRGGTLTIETGNIMLDEAYCHTRVQATPGPHVMIAVTDTGVGMTPEIMSRLFEPFFTTKEPGKGTGLGLATCHGIVSGSRGHIAAYSEPGRGTTFRVLLSRVPDQVHPAAQVERAAQPAGGKETILLAEDSRLVRDVTAEALREAGYTVLEAENGARAVEVAAMHPGKVDLLVTDVVMPEMGGVRLAEALSKEHPNLRVIFVSGYTEETIAHHGVATDNRAFLAKPFMTDTLLRTVREVLDGRRPERG